MAAEGAALRELVTALGQATLMARQLPNSSTLEPSQILHIYSSLHTAHHHLSLFLSHHPPPPPLTFQPQPSFYPTPSPPPLPENSVSSAVGSGGDDNYMEPMQVGDDDEVEHSSKTTTSAAAADAIEGVEERMRDCFIQKISEPKRALSPSVLAAAADLCREAAFGGGSSSEFDPDGTKLRSLDLIYQFHG